jgi:hypothetical protein
MRLSTTCPLCPHVMVTVGRPGPLLERARLDQLEDHALDHVRKGQPHAMSLLTAGLPGIVP